jgi:hypothetical protein
LVGWSVGHREVTQMSRCLFSFVTRACPSRPFYALWATPKTSLNFGWSVGRSRRSHTNVTLSLQFCHLGPTFLTPSRPCGPPRKQPSILVGRSVGWSVGWSIGHRQVTQMSLCLFSFITWARPSRPFYALQATPKTALNFGWLVGWLVGRSVGWSRGSHTNVTLPL